MERSKRYEKGMARLKELNDSSPIQGKLQAAFPDMMTAVAEFAFGDVHSRPGLDKKSRELVILSSIATLGFAPVELKSHIHMALNVGWTKEEILEALLQIAVYAGFPAAINAVFAAQEIFDARENPTDEPGNPSEDA